MDAAEYEVLQAAEIAAQLAQDAVNASTQA
jgi:hypothetical protein